jgi:hypothetical protein
LPVVLYGCETWSLTLKEERRLRVLSKISGSERVEETGEWRRLHNEELSNLYWSPKVVPVIKSRKMRWARHVVRMGRVEAYTGFWWGNVREGDYLGGPGVDVRTTLMITLMFYQAMFVNKCIIMTSCCVCTAATSRLLTCSTEIQGNAVCNSHSSQNNLPITD